MDPKRCLVDPHFSARSLSGLSLYLLARHRPADQRHRPARPQQPRPSRVDIAHHEPARPELLQGLAELLGALALAGLVGDAIEDALAVRVRLQAPEAPQPSVAERAIGPSPSGSGWVSIRRSPDGHDGPLRSTSSRGQAR